MEDRLEQIISEDLFQRLHGSAKPLLAGATKSIYSWPSPGMVDVLVVSESQVVELVFLTALRRGVICLLVMVARSVIFITCKEYLHMMCLCLT